MVDKSNSMFAVRVVPYAVLIELKTPLRTLYACDCEYSLPEDENNNEYDYFEDFGITIDADADFRIMDCYEI